LCYFEARNITIQLKKQFMRISCLLAVIFFSILTASAQSVQWTKKGDAYYEQSGNGIDKVILPSGEKKEFAGRAALSGVKVVKFHVTDDESKLLLYTNSQKVWRYDTRGEYRVYDRVAKKMIKTGGKLPASAQMFAKLSPDGKRLAYVNYFDHNIYVENLANGAVRQLTKDGSRKLINGTFDWVYEEEFGCRDGFRWSPDGKKIAFWQIDARQVRDYYMLNTIDSVYSQVVPVEYPKVGEPASPCRVGVLDAATGAVTWMNVPGDNRQHFIPRMEWTVSGDELIVQQLNRKQNESKLFLCNAANGNARKIFEETDKAWVDVKSSWSESGSSDGWEWLNDGREFLWVSEKDGWRHCYRIGKDGTNERLITSGAYDIMQIKLIDDKNNWLYFMASPDNATQKYLYRTRLDGSGTAERITPAGYKGTTDYELSPDGRYASFSFSSANSFPGEALVALPSHKDMSGKETALPAPAKNGQPITEFFQVKTEEGIVLDGWMVKPKNFDSTKKYPVVFYVYGEPAAQTVKDSYGSGVNFLYKGSMSADGYIAMSIDNRGTPAPRGREWRKSIYRNIGRLNIRDQAMAAKEILKWNFVDKDRIAVWGWSGGGSSTLNLLFQYPDIYKCGIAIAAVGNQLNYDNIYQERYMGLPQENMEDFVKGSPITYAKNLKGKLLYIHGTGDDNVHYQNAEQLVNALIKENKIFQFMPYPNRTHSISEGEGTMRHLQNLYTTFLKENCPPGAR
jgi:dipeptidyl-peptidase 4